jgi:hypothetical protein
MNRKALEKLRQEFEAMRDTPQRGRDVVNLASRLGRKKVNRGKEPTYESEFDIPVLTIPMHGSKNLKKGTQKSIFIQLEDDFIAWEQKLDQEERYQTALEAERKKRELPTPTGGSNDKRG